MSSRELLTMLREQARQIDAEAFRPPNAPDAAGTQSIAAAMARYNRSVFSELMDCTEPSAPQEVNSHALAEFTRRIDAYLDQYAPDFGELKIYIRIVSIYLAFIAHRPLHPPGMVMQDGLCVTFSGGMYTCPIKNREVREPLSLCPFCVCEDGMEMG